MGTEEYDRITDAVTQFTPSHVFALFSGGDDSLAMTSIVSQHPNFSACVHIDTGIGIWDNPDDRRSVARKFVERTCKERGWSLLIYEAAKYSNGKELKPQIYEQLVLEQGFPGSNEFGHRKMYNRLKFRPLLVLKREHKVGKHKMLFIAGCRKDESERRMGNTKPIDDQGREVWVNIIHDWSKDDCHSQINLCGLERNPTSLRICKSGECMCGAFAKSGELNVELKHYYPEFVAWLNDLERRVWEAGFPWKWDESPPKWFLQQRKGQKMMFDMTPEYDGPMPMCQSCIVNSSKTPDAFQDGT